MKTKLKTFWKDRAGSEATEMMGTVAMLICLILVAVMLLTYIMVYNNVAFATKRVVREVEVSGIANTSVMFNRFNEMLGDNPQITNRYLTLTNVTTADGKIQLKDTFRVNTSCIYSIQLINPGNFDGFRLNLPVRCSITGMSEVYFSGLD